MSLLGKFIESLQVRVTNASFREVILPFLFDGKIDDKNVLILLNKGNMHVGSNNTPIKPENFYFIPQGEHAHIKLGKLKNKFNISINVFSNDDHQKQYFKDISGLNPWDDKGEVITVIAFELLLFNAIPFFPLLGMPSLTIPHGKEFLFLVNHIALEQEQQKLGKDIIINNYMQEIVIHFLRYVESQPHLHPYIDKLHYLADKRLLTIVNYIQQNLDKDLSNKAVAQVAYVSEDYVGQFFKSLTNRNLQEYIENQRLEKAMSLLKTLPDSVLEIASQVGFKDPAYFSRRFKNKYGVNATEVKRQKEGVK